jgi:hypothetical protein
MTVMQPQNTSRSVRARHRATALGAALAVVSLGACSSEQAPAAVPGESVPAQSVNAPADSAAAPTEPPAPAASTSAPQSAEPGELFPICDTIPALEVISAIVGTPVDTVTDYSTPPVEVDGQVLRDDRCEATGADIGLAIFERYDLQQGNDLLATVTTVPIGDPRVPGAIGWANGVMIESDGAYWYATAITPSTVGVADAPEAYLASTDLLAAWIGV